MESSQEPPALPALIPSTPQSWLCPGRSLRHAFALLTSLSLDLPFSPFQNIETLPSLSPSMHDASLDLPDSGSTSTNNIITLPEIKELTHDLDAPINTAFQSQKRTQPLKMTPSLYSPPRVFLFWR